MSLSKKLQARSNGTCELCEAGVANNIYSVPHGSGADIDTNVHLCEKCLAQIEITEELIKLKGNRPASIIGLKTTMNLSVRFELASAVTSKS